MFDSKGAKSILTSRKLTHEQKLMGLAKAAENGVGGVTPSAGEEHFFKTGAINDLFEGSSPYRPRYTMPDYGRFVRQGSEFLRLAPPADLDELLTSLMIIYRHVPSITNFPVFIGDLDTLIDPFLAGVSDGEASKKLKLFLTYLDRTITDSFCHANLGPQETRAGRLLLAAEAELANAVPNMTIKYDPAITPPAFMEEALLTSLLSSNPAVANDALLRETYRGGYGISSCYNVLPLCGGAYTLTRLTLPLLAREASGIKAFMDDLLPDAIGQIGNYMNKRIRFLVEESSFFESNFLVREGLLDQERFVGMFGVTGMAECVNQLFADKDIRYGRDEAADELAVAILDRIKQCVGELTAVHSPLTGNRFVLHAQVGLDSDKGITSGVRIPIGQEPEDFLAHLRHSGRFHGYFPAGVGDIFPIETATRRNLAALLDVVKGAFSVGMTYMSFYAADADLVRITGYLVKRSEMRKWERDEAVLQNTVHLGAPYYGENRLAERRVRMV